MGTLETTFITRVTSKIGQNVCLDKILDECQITEITCGHAKGYSSCIDLKISQNVFFDKILDKFKIGSPWIIT